jgi:hypothetical protein
MAMYCLNAENGEEIWKREFETFREPQSTPAVDGKYVYGLSKDGVLRCLKVKKGKVKWERDLVEEFDAANLVYGYAQSPVVADDLLIVNADTIVFALDKKTGSLTWSTKAPLSTTNREGSYSTPVLYNTGGARSALFFTGTGLFSVELQSGKHTWLHEWYSPGYPNVVDPIVFRDRVFISTGYRTEGCLLEMSAHEPVVVWRNKNMPSDLSTAVLIDGYLYGSDGPGLSMHILRCVSWETGEIMWEQEMKGASLISADGKLIILEEDGTLHIAEATPSGYEELSSCDVLEGEKKRKQFWTPPVLCNGRIYCRNFSGDLVCIDVSR